MDIIVRTAEQRDDYAICRLIKDELGYPDLEDAGIVKRLSFFRSSANDALFVAERETAIVGFIGVMKGIAYNVEGYYSQIMALAVASNARRMGIGTKLVRHAEKWSVTQGIYNIGVNSGLQREDTHMFYEMNGYQRKSYSFSKQMI